MHTILKIGHRHYLFSKVEDATRVMTLLSKAMPMDSEFCVALRAYKYTPKPPESCDGINLEIVDGRFIDLSSLKMKKVSGPVRRTGPALLEAPQPQVPLWKSDPFAPRD